MLINFEMCENDFLLFLHCVFQFNKFLYIRDHDLMLNAETEKSERF